METSARHDAMDVRMKVEVARPRMKHGGDAEQPTQALGVEPETQQRLRSGIKQQGIQIPSISQDERAQLCRQSEHHVKVMHRQDAQFALFEPAVLRQRLALGAVPVATRIVLRLPMTAAAAQLYVPAESGGAASGERRQHLSLLRRQGFRSELPCMVPNDLRDLVPWTRRRSGRPAGPRKMSQATSLESPRPHSPASPMGSARTGALHE